MSQTSASKAKTSEQAGSQPNVSEQAAAMAAAMKVEPQREHRWLQKLIGEWTYESEMPGPEGQPSQKMTGSERVRAIGEIWVQGEGTGQMPDGTPATSQITLGYDPAKKRFVGTWLGSMMNHLWIYDGELSADERKLTLSSDGPSMTEEGKLAKYRDVIELKNENLRSMTAFVQGADGQWTQFMTMDYHRKK
jgi:hypothetical protein